MILKGKKGIILGLANSHSIAYACADSAVEMGAEIIVSYLDERFLKWVTPLCEKLNAKYIPLDVTKDESIDNFFNEVSKIWDKVDFLVHAIAFAKSEDLEGRFVDTSRAGFSLALDISAYSLVAVSKRVASLMKNGGSIITLSYYGAEKVVPSYNVMGVAKAALEASVRYLASDLGSDNIRVNAISAGPINTLSARGISGFTKILHHVQAKAPLKRNVLASEIGNTAAFLASDLSSGITGETIYVDCGFNIMGG
ncbi:MAG: enoyl-ACP reductase [Spirochaetota bacterium]